MVMDMGRLRNVLVPMETFFWLWLVTHKKKLFTAINYNMYCESKITFVANRAILKRKNLAKKIYEEFTGCLDHVGIKMPLSRHYFIDLWNDKCPPIRILKRGSE